MKEILLAMLITSVFISGILLYSIAQQEPQQVIEIQPTVTPTPTPDRERIQLMQENERLRQEVKHWKCLKLISRGL